MTASLDHDDLPGDNRFDQVVLVRDTVNVLIIDGGINERDPEKSSSYFLAHALAPVKDTDRAKYYLQPKVCAPRLAARRSSPSRICASWSMSLANRRKAA